MSRLQRYKESLQRFIKEKSCLYIDNSPCKVCEQCLMDNPCPLIQTCSSCRACPQCSTCKACKLIKTSLFCVSCSGCKTCFPCDSCNRDINSYIFSLIQNNDSIYSTLFLTIMNNQNKKNRMSIQGYYIASCIEFMDVLSMVIENRDILTEKFGIPKYIKLANNLFIYASKSLQQNIEIVKNTFTIPNLNDIILTSLSLLNDTFINIMSLYNYKFDILNSNCNGNIVDWYLKTDDILIKKFNTLNQISKPSLKAYITKKYFLMSDLAITLGWIFGNGSINSLSNFKSTVKHFGMMYKLSTDFQTLDKDIMTPNIYTLNYVLNFGLQDAYEEFINSKQLFISDMLTLDVYSNTLKEIIDKIEITIDTILDQTSPDLKSSYSMDFSNKP